MELDSTGDGSNLISLPLSEFSFILFNDRHLLHHVSLCQLGPFLIVGDIENVQLLWIPIFSIYRLNIVIARLERVVVNACTNPANENTMLQFKVS